MLACSNCSTRYAGAFCPECGSAAAGRRLTGQRTLVGLGGAALVGGGVFLPFAHMPIVGDINYFLNGNGDGTILLIAAATAAALVFLRWSPLLVALCGLVVLGFTLHFYYVFDHAKLQLDHAVSTAANSPFGGLAAGIGASLAQSIFLEYGFFVVALGGLLLLITPFIQSRNGLV